MRPIFSRLCSLQAAVKNHSHSRHKIVRLVSMKFDIISLIQQVQRDLNTKLKPLRLCSTGVSVFRIQKNLGDDFLSQDSPLCMEDVDDA